MAPVGGQAVVLALTLLTGGLLGLLFDTYRLLRGRLRPGSLATAAGDFIFVLLATACTFFLMLLVNWAEFRLYVIVGFAAGATAYHFLLSRLVLHAGDALLRAASRTLRSVAGPLGGLFRELSRRAGLGSARAGSLVRASWQQLIRQHNVTLRRPKRAGMHPKL